MVVGVILVSLIGVIVVLYDTQKAYAEQSMKEIKTAREALETIRDIIGYDAESEIGNEPGDIAP